MATKCSISICVHRGDVALQLWAPWQGDSLIIAVPEASSAQQNLVHCSENEISSVSAIIFSIRQRLGLKLFLWQIFAKKVTQGMRKKM